MILSKKNIELYQIQANKKSNKLIYHNKKKIYVFADLYMLNTILRNLIINAVKFSSNSDIFIDANVEMNLCFISIKDTGIGIKPGRIENLFKIEKTYSTIGTNKEKGSGLGLNICKEFIEKNGGTITVKSQINVGSTFTFTLPVINT
jgi:signal transduction histidine kinase